MRAPVIRWVTDDLVLADGDTLARVYEVSKRTVRRYCPVVEYTAGRVALYDALAAEEHLAGVYPRDRRPAAVRDKLKGVS